jgi:Tfp pilus assembly protein PilX
MSLRHLPEKLSRGVRERGVAMVASLMALLLLSGMGLTLVLTVSTETALSGNYRRNEQAFFAADAGIGVARESLRQQVTSALQTNANTVAANTTITTSNFNDSSFATSLFPSSIYSTSGTVLTTATSNANTRSSSNNILGGYGKYNVTLTLTPVGTPTVTRVGIPANQPPSSVAMTYEYTISSTGDNGVSTSSLNYATAQATERGRINVTLAVDNPNYFNRSFSRYAAFFNRFSGTFAAGTYTGPVHTNQGFGFSSSSPLTFNGAVTQVNTNYTYNGSSYAVSSTDRTGLTFNSTFTTTSNVPLPTNVYSQELAVLNSTGVDSSTGNSRQPTISELTSGLRTASNTAPSTTSGGTVLANGVYVPSDGTSVTGGGIYVQGSASDIQMSVNSSGHQVYRITQGSTVTTVTVVAPSGTSAGSTTIASGSSSTTYSGVPMDKTNPNAHRQGASLFVNGSIGALHGPAASGGATGNAISASTAVTVTSTSDITITGDLKYAQPVLDNSGNTTSYSTTATNVLGIFTNSGRVTLNPSSTYTAGNYSLTLDAAIATFNEAALNSNSSLDTGMIYYAGPTLNSNSRLTLRGSRIQSKIGYIGYGSSGAGQRNVYFDPRFNGGSFAPPFFPVTGLSTVSGAITIAATTASQSNTWQRINN